MENVIGLVKYDAMCRAITECHKIDEVKDIRDRAKAFEVYAKEAMNNCEGASNRRAGFPNPVRTRHMGWCAHKTEG